MRILCGPVIGLVTTKSAKVLVEIDETRELTMVLKNVKTGYTFCITRWDITAKRPLVFSFEGLTENTKYHVLIPDVQESHLGEVRTIPEDVTKINIGVISCDLAKMEPKKDMWEQLYYNATKNEAHVIMHIGDNVYIDEEVSYDFDNQRLINDEKALFNAKKVDQNIPYVKARGIMRDVPKHRWNTKREEILEVYRDKYRQTWTRTFKAKVLANFSNLMILDDHEIRDDFGSEPQDGDPDHVEFFLGGLAVRVYHEYQRQLWDPDILYKHEQLTSEYYSVIFGPIGIIMLDARLTTSLYKSRRLEGDESYYGRQQVNELTRDFNNSSVRMWIVAASLPLMFLKRKINQLAERTKIADDMAGFINVKNVNDFIPMLDMFRSWKESMGPTGDLMIVAGDVHIGGFTDIYYKGENGKGRPKLVCRQVTTSPIQNKHWKFHEYTAIRTLMRFKESYGSYGYKHYDWVNSCNFAMLHLDFTNTRSIRYQVELVHEKGTMARDSQDTNWDKNTDCCCAVM